MNSPIKSNMDYISNLKNGDPVYTVMMDWYKDKCEWDIKVDRFIFDSYLPEKVTIDENGKHYNANLKHAGGVNCETHDLNSGFFKTPLEALESSESMIKSLLSSIHNSIDKENKRLSKIVDVLSSKK